jgi:hypothetical protein
MFAALLPLLEELGPLLMGEGAGAEAAGAEGAAAKKLSKSEKQIADFNNLFEPTEEEKAAKKARPNEPQQGGDNGKNPLEQASKMMKGLKEFDDTLGTATKVVERFSVDTQLAMQNKFIPLIADILPENMGKLVKATAGLVDAFVQRGKELENFSPQLQMANAVVDMKTMMADFKEANTLGGPVASMTVSSNDIWLQIRDILLPIKQFMAEVGADILETLKNMMQFLIDCGLIDLIKFLVSIEKFLYNVFGPNLLKLIFNTSKEEKSPNFAAELIAFMDHAMDHKFRDPDPRVADPRRGDPKPGGPPPVLNIPAFG